MKTFLFIIIFLLIAAFKSSAQSQSNDTTVYGYKLIYISHQLGEKTKPWAIIEDNDNGTIHETKDVLHSFTQCLSLYTDQRYEIVWMYYLNEPDVAMIMPPLIVRRWQVLLRKKRI